jgi:hypothetical protein
MTQSIEARMAALEWAVAAAFVEIIANAPDPKAVISASYATFGHRILKLKKDGALDEVAALKALHDMIARMPSERTDALQSAQRAFAEMIPPDGTA